MERTITDAETQKKAELEQLVASGASVDAILAATKELSKIILDAAEAEAALKFQGHTWTAEQRAALSAKLKGRPGKPWTEEQKQKIRDSWTPEKKAALSAKLTGRHLTDDQKAKLSNSLKQGKIQRQAEQDQLRNRIAELEAMIAGNAPAAAVEAVAEQSVTEPVADEADQPKKPRRGFGRQ